MEKPKKYNPDHIQRTEFILEYTNKVINLKVVELQHANWKLGTMLGFTGLLLRFCLDLPESYLSLQILKTIAICSTGLCALVCVRGVTGEETQGGLGNPIIFKSEKWKPLSYAETLQGSASGDIGFANSLISAANKKRINLNWGSWLFFSAIVTTSLIELLDLWIGD